MLQLKVLVLEVLSTVDAPSSSSITRHKVSSLDHKSLDDSVELASLVPYRPPIVAFGLAGAELTKVLCCLWANIRAKFDLDASERLAWSVLATKLSIKNPWYTSERNVEKDNRVPF